MAHRISDGGQQVAPHGTVARHDLAGQRAFGAAQPGRRRRIGAGVDRRFAGVPRTGTLLVIGRVGRRNAHVVRRRVDVPESVLGPQAHHGAPGLPLEEGGQLGRRSGRNRQAQRHGEAEGGGDEILLPWRAGADRAVVGLARLDPAERVVRLRHVTAVEMLDVRFDRGDEFGTQVGVGVRGDAQRLHAGAPVPRRAAGLPAIGAGLHQALAAGAQGGVVAVAQVIGGGGELHFFHEVEASRHQVSQVTHARAVRAVPAGRIAAARRRHIRTGGRAAIVLETLAVADGKGRIFGKTQRSVGGLVAVVDAIAAGGEAVAHHGAVGNRRIRRQVQYVVQRQHADRVLIARGGHVVAIIVEIAGLQRGVARYQLAHHGRIAGDAGHIGRHQFAGLQVGAVMARGDARIERQPVRQRGAVDQRGALVVFQIDGGAHALGFAQCESEGGRLVDGGGDVQVAVLDPWQHFDGAARPQAHFQPGHKVLVGADRFAVDPRRHARARHPGLERRVPIGAAEGGHAVGARAHLGDDFGGAQLGRFKRRRIGRHRYHQQPDDGVGAAGHIGLAGQDGEFQGTVRPGVFRGDLQGARTVGNGFASRDIALAERITEAKRRRLDGGRCGKAKTRAGQGAAADGNGRRQLGRFDHVDGGVGDRHHVRGTGHRAGGGATATAAAATGGQHGGGGDCARFHNETTSVAVDHNVFQFGLSVGSQETLESALRTLPWVLGAGSFYQL